MLARAYDVATVADAAAPTGAEARRLHPVLAGRAASCGTERRIAGTRANSAACKQQAARRRRSR